TVDRPLLDEWTQALREDASAPDEWTTTSNFTSNSTLGVEWIAAQRSDVPVVDELLASQTLDRILLEEHVQRSSSDALDGAEWRAIQRFDAPLVDELSAALTLDRVFPEESVRSLDQSRDFLLGVEFRAVLAADRSLIVDWSAIAAPTAGS